MSRYLTLIAVPCVGLFTFAIQAQERSFYQGKPVQHPEALSGLWETSDGRGGAIGIHLLLDTSVPGDATSLNGATQSWQELQVGVFERRGSAMQTGEANYFADSVRGGGLRFENGRLTLHFVSSFAGAPSIDLDLHQQLGERWAGRLHRGSFDAQVILRRPGSPGVNGTSPIVGAWSDSSTPGRTCMHIVEEAPGEFTGWSDALLTWGSVTVAPHVARPTTAMQHYGELMKVRPEGAGRFSFELYAYSGVCCSHTFTGLPEAHGDRMEGFWPAGANQAPRKSSWRKMRGDSCNAE